MALVEVDDRLAVPAFTQADLAERADVVHAVTVTKRVRTGHDLDRPFKPAFDYGSFRLELGVVRDVLK